MVVQRPIDYPLINKYKSQKTFSKIDSGTKKTFLATYKNIHS